MKVVFATPTRDEPSAPYLNSLEACLPAIEAEGFTHQNVNDIGCPYISASRCRMLGKALKVGFDYVVFIDDDVSWQSADMVNLLKAEGDVVGGTYRFKNDDETYMGVPMLGATGRPLVRDDGCIEADRLPAGFLRVSWRAVWRFAAAYPQLVVWADPAPSVDLFNHGAHSDGLWWGEDYSFCRRWRGLGGDVWLVPDLDLTHHGKDKAYPGNYHRWLLKQPGGKEHGAG